MIRAVFPYTRPVGRKEYALRLLLCAVISAPVLWWRPQVVRAHEPSEALIFIAVLIVVLVITQAQLIGRLRDMGTSAVFSGLVFVPYLNAAFALALLILPGQTRAVHQVAGP